MYIKRIIIEGFKTYKDRVVIEFDAGMTIIAGANGSGKSNIYEAIEFVLSEKFTGIRGDSRSKLLHEGAGKAVMSAYVELIFDNSDGRFPDDKKEVSLKRTLGVKKDEYFLNNKHVTKQEVDNMLESAGISRSNPYYIVRQGEVMKLIQMKTTERLELFKEIAGTRVYDERRKESAKIMQDTERRYTDIDEVISDLDSRLADLQGEKDELREFQQLDRERRCLEFNIYDHDLRKYTRALEEADAQRQRLAAQTAETHNQAMNVQDARAAAEDQLSELHQAVSLAQADRDRTQKEARDQRKRVAALEFKVKDREETATSMGSQRAALMTEQRTVQKEIDKAERSLTQTVRPQFETQKTAEATLSEELRRTQARQQTLYGKQGRVSQHKTKSERDASLKAECAQIEALVKQERKEQSILETEARAAEDDLTRYETELKRREEETNAARKSLDELRHQQSAALQRRDQLNDARRARWKEQAALTREVSEKKEQLRKAEGALYSTLSRSTAAGLAVLHRVVQQHNIQGVYGPLIDLIQCDQRYDKSVETVAGNKLFQIVVDSDDTVDRLLSLMKQERAGRLTFMPLNRLLVEEVQYPTNTDQAIPLILQLRFEPKFRPAVMQVFGSTLLARNLQVGAELSKTHNFDCITLDGDQVNRRGAFTGGFIDSRRSRMEAHKSIKALTAEVASLSAKAESAKAEEQRADQEITTLLGDQQKCDAQQAKLRDQLKSVSGDMESARRRKVAAAENFNKLNEQAAKALKTASDLDERLAALKEEMKAPFIDLTPAEQAELDSLGAQELDLQQRLSAAARQRASSEAEIKKLENALATNLRRRLNELKARLSTAEDDEAASALETARHDLGLAQKELDELETKLKDLEQELENKTNAARAIEAEREKQQHDEAKGMNSLQSSMQEIEKVMSKQSLVQQQRDDCLRKIRELGSLPAEAHQDELRQMGAKELTAKLTKNLKQMEKFKNVNRKAIDQFMQLNDKRAELVKKKEELDKGKKAIEDLIGNLDMKKDEAILRTFKGISKNFTEVFRELVPGGKAILRMEKKAVKKQGEQESEEIDDNTAATGPLQYHGVEINVSFSGSDQAFEMQQLSGGQKTVVALALIFAIQRCDPSPFYVFDEIDAALDPLYRTAVANMLSEHRKTTQFIVTTFRPELLEAADRFLLVRFEAKISLVAEAQKEAVTRVLRAVEEEYERASAAAGAR